MSDIIPEMLKFHPSIVGASIGTTMEKRIYPEVNTKGTFTIDFGNKLYHPRSCYDVPVVESSYFNMLVLQNNSLVQRVCYFDDDGNGKMRIYTLDNKVYLNNNAGTVDYNKGIVVIKDLVISSYINNNNYIYFVATPNDPDIFTDFDTILSFDNTITRSSTVNMTQVFKNSLTNASYANRNSSNNVTG
jgi:hypothetical protein